MSAELPPPRRYITVNDERGESFFSSAEPEEVGIHQDLGGAKQRLAYTSLPPKIDFNDNQDLAHYQDALKNLPQLVRSDGGTNVWYIDTPPGAKSPEHRTVSFDIVIQVQGTVKLILSSGDSRTIKPGDITIQRSTLHTWENPSPTEWSRFIGIMTESQPVVTKEAGQLNAEFRV